MKAFRVHFAGNGLAREAPVTRAASAVECERAPVHPGAMAAPPDRSRWRCVSETEMLDLLLLEGWAWERDAPGARNAAAAALARLRETGLSCEPGPGGSLYDPVEAATLLRRLGRARREPLFADRLIPFGRRNLRDLAGEGPGEKPPDWSRHPAGRAVCLTLRRRFPADALPLGRPARLRLPVPLPGPGVSGLEVEVLEQPSGTPPATLSPGRMEVRLPAPADAVLALRATAVIAPLLPGALLPQPLEPAEAALFLRPEEGFVRVTPAVAALAASVGGGRPGEVAHSLWRILLDRVQIEPIHYAEIDTAAPGDWVLARGAADCQLVSALLVAMFRARGIPARLVGGVLAYPRAPSRHWWAEAHLDGAWHPFDAMARDLDDDGRVRAWHDAFAGQLEPRLVTERHPRVFTGAPGMPFPPAWLMLRRLTPEGAAVRHLEASTGRLLYEEEIAVTLGPLIAGPA